MRKLIVVMWVVAVLWAGMTAAGAQGQRHVCETSDSTWMVPVTLAGTDQTVPYAERPALCRVGLEDEQPRPEGEIQIGDGTRWAGPASGGGLVGAGARGVGTVLEVARCGDRVGQGRAGAYEVVCVA